ncbi:hypothetical protein ACFVJ5_05215 [Nocardia sp. NPDC127606]|uniref:hypothetical protein n=1 Tax=Nocardia sp. NPDC127606 TaxID=3345406 RepID=UPI00362D543B
MSITAHRRAPWTPNKRAVLEALHDGEPQWAERLYAQLAMPRRNSAAHALGWLYRHGYLAPVTGEDGYVVIGPDRTDQKYVLTDKGRAAAQNLDAGFDYLNP